MLASAVKEFIQEMDEIWHHAKWKKPDRIWYDSTYMNYPDETKIQTQKK